MLMESPRRSPTEQIPQTITTLSLFPLTPPTAGVGLPKSISVEHQPSLQLLGNRDDLIRVPQRLGEVPSPIADGRPGSNRLKLEPRRSGSGIPAMGVEFSCSLRTAGVAVPCLSDGLEDFEMTMVVVLKL